METPNIAEATAKSTHYGAVSSALYVLNTFLKKNGKVIAVRIAPPGKNPDAHDIAFAPIQDVQIMTIQQARNNGYQE